MKLWIAIAYNLNITTEEKTRVAKRQTLLGPFKNAREANEARQQQYQAQLQNKLEGYAHQFIFLKTDNKGKLTVIDVPLDGGKYHTYRIHLASGMTLRVTKCDTWSVTRPGVVRPAAGRKKNPGQLTLTTDKLKPDDVIGVKWERGWKEETVVRIERLELSWNGDLRD